MICDTPGKYIESEKTAQDKALGNCPIGMSGGGVAAAGRTEEEWSMREELVVWCRLQSREQSSRAEGRRQLWQSMLRVRV